MQVIHEIIKGYIFVTFESKTHLNYGLTCKNNEMN